MWERFGVDLGQILGPILALVLGPVLGSIWTPNLSPKGFNVAHWEFVAKFISKL